MSSCGRSRRLCWFNKRPTLLSCCFLSFLLPVPLFPQAVRLSHFLQGQWHRMQSKPCTSLRPWRYSTVSFALSLFSLCKWLRMVKPCSPGSDQTHDNHRFKFFTSSLYLSLWSFIFLKHLKEHNKAAVLSKHGSQSCLQWHSAENKKSCEYHSSVILRVSLMSKLPLFLTQVPPKKNLSFF